MVILTTITTRTGDDGTTALADGVRRPKSCPLLGLIGEIDELNSCLGLALSVGRGRDGIGNGIAQIQNHLFDLGADLSTPHEPTDWKPVRLMPSSVLCLEAFIHDYNNSLGPLTSFILPGGNSLSAHLHIARCVCRRAERHYWLIKNDYDLKPIIGLYLNRLSDLLFIWARFANRDDGSETLWIPNQNT
jgi:cob(I)alamin adenosyltransferase